MALSAIVRDLKQTIILLYIIINIDTRSDLSFELALCPFTFFLAGRPLLTFRHTI